MPRYGPCIDPDESRNLVSLQIRRERFLCPPPMRCAGQFADDETRDPRPPGLRVEVRDAVVADHRGRHHDDLAGERGIRQDFLVSGVIRREHDLPDSIRAASRESARKSATVLQQEGSVMHLRQRHGLRPFRLQRTN